MNYEQYINELYQRQNINASTNTQNLVPREFYESMVLGVEKVLKENPDASLSELRNILIKKSKIEEKIRDFCLIKKNAPGMVVSLSTKNYHHEFYAGNKEEVVANNGQLEPNVVPMNNDTIFDLASTTKLFTGIATLKLVEISELNINDEVTKYVPQFANLKGITIFDLLSYRLLGTDKRVDSAKSREEAESILFTAYPKELKQGESTYNDFTSMVLKYVIEKVSGMEYYSFLKSYILDPLQMTATLVKIGDDKIDRVASTNNDVRLYKDGNIVERNYINKGISSDDKARVLGQPEGNLSGHAGLFSTAKDMEKLANALITNSIISAHLRDEMAKNRTGYIYTKPDGSKSATQYLGMLCYSKNPILPLSEVHHPLSGNALAAAGWSGTQFTMDPTNEINLFMGSNRSHNRVTINGQPDKVVLKDSGEKVVTLPNGREVIDASRYAYDRDDAIIHPAIELTFELKILEDILEIKDLDKEESSTVIR